MRVWVFNTHSHTARFYALKMGTTAAETLQILTSFTTDSQITADVNLESVEKLWGSAGEKDFLCLHISRTGLSLTKHRRPTLAQRSTPARLSRIQSLEPFSPCIKGACWGPQSGRPQANAPLLSSTRGNRCRMRAFARAHRVTLRFRKVCRAQRWPNSRPSSAGWGSPFTRSNSGSWTRNAAPRQRCRLVSGPPATASCLSTQVWAATHARARARTGRVETEWYAF